MIFPPLIMARLQQTALLKSKPFLRIPMEIGVIAAMVGAL